MTFSVEVITMKITQKELQIIIREELRDVLAEEQIDENMKSLALGALMSLFGSQALASDGQPPAQSTEAAQQVAQQQPSAAKKFIKDFQDSANEAFQSVLDSNDYTIEVLGDKDGPILDTIIAVKGLKNQGIESTPKRGNDILGNYDKIESAFQKSMTGKGHLKFSFGETDRFSQPGVLMIKIKLAK